MKNSIMKKITAALLIGTLTFSTITLTGCTGGTPNQSSSDENLTDAQKFEALCDEIFRDEMESDTITLHYTLANPSEYGLEDMEPTLGEFSQAEIKKDAEDAKEAAEKLAKIDRAQLSDSQKVTYDILAASLEVSIEAGAYDYYYEPAQPSLGIQSQLPVLLAEYTLRNEKDVTDYLAILADIERYYGQVLTYEQEKSKKGLFMSDTLADEAIDNCNSFLKNVDDNYLIETFDERIDALEGLSDDKKAEYKAQNKELVTGTVMDAYRLLADGLTALKGTGSNEGGICNFKQGKEYYDYLLKSSVGTDRSAEELEDMILDQINTNIQKIQFITSVNSSVYSKFDSFSFSKTEPKEILADLQEKMKDDYPDLPCEVTYEVKYVQEALEDSLSPAFYLTPPLDALTENVIYVNRGQTNENTLYSTIAHEGFPGHLYQTVYSSACTDDTLIRSVCSSKGFTEGWATYVEFNSYKYDTANDADLLEVMKCNDDVTLGIYALLDLYINYDGFTLADTKDFLSQLYDSSAVDSFAQDLYTLIVAQPANYLNYYVGYLEFDSLKKEAQELAGDAFDLKEFHKLILETGDCPFYLLHEYVQERYGAAK